MTLEEAFERFEDDMCMVRRSWKVYIAYDIKWLRVFKSYGNQESRDIGFPSHDEWIEDANADDWEPIIGVTCSNNDSP